jgi:hypothetical protein
MSMHGYFFPGNRTPVDPANPPSSPGADLQRAIFEALTGDAYMMTLVNGVYDFVPAARADIAGREADPWGAVQGYISFGPMDVTNDNAECLESGHYTVQLDAWSRQKTSVHCRKIVDQVRRILDGTSFDLPTGNALVGLTIEAWRFMRDPDGLTTHGVVSVQGSIEDES